MAKSTIIVNGLKFFATLFLGIANWGFSAKLYNWIFILDMPILLIWTMPISYNRKKKQPFAVSHCVYWHWLAYKWVHDRINIVVFFYFGKKEHLDIKITHSILSKSTFASVVYLRLCYIAYNIDLRIVKLLELSFRRKQTEIKFVY